ncbi:MAG: TRAP transporter substrate-binding protein DctP [Chloroflexi bacterium]|nr:TRAP transporter substrate-binding protein DctP [Chloroflexota bacterium]
MKTKRYLFLVISIILLVGLSLPIACAQPAPTPAPAPAPAPAPKKFVFKSVSFIPSPTKRAVAFKAWQDEITKRSNGELVCEYAGGPEVIGAKQQPTATRAGAVEMSTVGGSHVMGLVPEVSLLALSRISAPEERAVGATDFLRKLYAKAGLYYVGRLDPKPQQNFYITSKVKLTGVNDFKGKAFGANGTYVQAFAEALGTSFTVVNMPEAFGALDRGLIQMYSTSIDLQANLGIPEVNKFVIDHPFYQSNTTIIINLDAWNSLPDHLQKLVMDTYLDFEQQFIDGAYDGVVVGAKKFEDAGAEFVKFSDAEAKRFLDLAYSAESAKWLEKLPDSAPGFLKMVNAIQ